MNAKTGRVRAECTARLSAIGMSLSLFRYEFLRGGLWQPVVEVLAATGVISGWVVPHAADYFSSAR